MAVCRAGAAAKNIPLYRHIAELAKKTTEKFVLPVPMFGMISGGVQLSIMPIGASSFTQAMRMGTEVYHSLKTAIESNFGPDAINVGDEGGFAPNIQDNSEKQGPERLWASIKERMMLIQSAIDEAGHSGDVKIAIDLDPSNGHSKFISYAELYEEIVKEYPRVVSIENPLGPDDMDGFSNSNIGQETQIVGCNLLVGDMACNAISLKIDQIGTVTKAIEAVNEAQKSDRGVLTSLNTGETEDTFIADLVVGLGAGQIKAGAPSRGERVAKCNQLLRIEEESQVHIVYAGNAFRNPKQLLQ